MRSTATALVLAVTACAAASQAPTGGFDSTRAYGHMRDLVEIGPRVSGTPANVKTRQYIISTLGCRRASRPPSSRSRPERRWERWRWPT